jgi:beta-fructofuranosidase
MANPLASDLDAMRRLLESQAHPGRYAQRFHVVPPVGWLNDPNGLCQLGDTFHAFFQYSPFNAEGGVKMWGHVTSPDLVTWSYEGAALYPDQPFDVSGVYSGCAFVKDGTMHVFYTGNVKREDDENYDYVNSGREANTIHVETKDGFNFGPKKVVMDNSDYPADVTEHVRDPKVWEFEGRYYMVQGARKQDDSGEVLIFVSDDLSHWELVNRVTSCTSFGYMWECPDYFELPDPDPLHDHKLLRVLSVSPQGLHGGDWDRRNVYQSGYFVVRGDITGTCWLKPFALWDAGFDFYAPQTFETTGGRRILIGWMGMPDEKTYTNLTVKDGWQHCFTVPREVTARWGRVLQWPVRELASYRGALHRGFEDLEVGDTRCFDLMVYGKLPLQSLDVTIADELHLTWDGSRFEMRFSDTDKQAVGAGRVSRFEPLDELRNLRVVGDVSSVEVFVNDGELSFSTRYYPKSYGTKVSAPGCDVRLWDLCFDEQEA